MSRRIGHARASAKRSDAHPGDTAIAYPALLAGHLVAVAVFLAGLFTTAALLPGLTAAPNPDELRRLRRLGHVATTPALLALWAFGIAMAVAGGWFAADWLRIKLLFVVLLSAWHRRQSATLWRLAAGRPVARTRHRATLVPALATIAIVALVVGKPF